MTTRKASMTRQQLREKMDELDNWHQTGCPFSDTYGKCTNGDCNKKRKIFKNEILHLIDEYVLDEKRQLQIDDRLVMLGWIEANQDNLKVSEIIGTLQAQVKDLEAEQRRRAGIGEKE